MPPSPPNKTPALSVGRHLFSTRAAAPATDLLPSMSAASSARCSATSRLTGFHTWRPHVRSHTRRPHLAAACALSGLPA
eukprot:84882-Chlamydomonas_euryale.AAC.1